MDAPKIEDVTSVFKDICPGRPFEYRLERFLAVLEIARGLRPPAMESHPGRVDEPAYIEAREAFRRARA